MQQIKLAIYYLLIIVFADDVRACISDHMIPKPTFLYVHFSYIYCLCNILIAIIAYIYIINLLKITFHPNSTIANIYPSSYYINIENSIELYLMT